MPDVPLVLDTHMWIWIVEGNHTIDASVRQTIREALKKSRVLIPAICVWEVGMLVKKNRIQLKEPLVIWVRSALERSGFALAPLSEAIAVESTVLPGNFHSDPADCMIVATARLEKALLLTRDSRIVEYGQAGHVNVMTA